jgi:hypothetical protein
VTTAYAPDWLALREGADAAARATALLPPLREWLAARPVTVLDAGCGTGSMTRWLIGRIPRAGRWILHDHDSGLLELAAHDQPYAETRLGDLSGLDLTGVTLLTASALLEILNAEQVEGLADACAVAGCAALLTLSVTGGVEFAPPEPADAALRAAFNDHQRRSGLLGPQAWRHATVAFERCGYVVTTAPSPWRLGPADAALTAEWFRGWSGAALQQDPSLPVRSMPRAAVVQHRDLLALPWKRQP